MATKYLLPVASELREKHPVSRMRNLQRSFNQRCMGMRYVELQTNRLRCEFRKAWQYLTLVRLFI
jgi:hypothetical protein